MAALSPSEAVTQSFYAWETRGRGWMLSDYPVSLEPPFRPFFVLPELVPQQFARIDDGKRPTIASFLVERAIGLFTGRAEPEATFTSFEEEPPFPAFPRGPLTALRILVPEDHEHRADVMAQLLGALSAALHPVSFELVGRGGSVSIQVVCAATDCDDVRAQIEGFMPEVAALEDEDKLAASWDSEAAHLAVDFGLTHEFFLPLIDGKGLRVDPYVPLVAALARAGVGELLVLQVLVERVHNPWSAAIREALLDSDGECVIADAPWFLDAAKEKTKAPLSAVAVRVAAQAAMNARAWELVQGTRAFIAQYAHPSGNALIPLENDGYDDELHAASLLRRESFRTGMILSAEELVSLFHFPDQAVRNRALVRGHVRTKELPAVARRHELVLGEHRHRGERSIASLDLESRFAHAWLIGGSGTGKSTLIANLVLQDIAAGHGLVVLDPHGDLVDDIAARIPEEQFDRVVMFDPSDVEYPIGFNILDAPTEIERNLLTSDLVAILRRFTTSWGDTMSTVLGEAVLSVLSHPGRGTLSTLKRLLVDDAFRAAYLAHVRDEEVRYFWKVEYPAIGTRSIGPLISRLGAFLRSRVVRNIVAQGDAKLNLGDVMNGGKVLLARLSKGLIGEENAYLLGALLLAKCNQCALARQAIPKEKRRPFFCYADEFQHFVTPSMESLATEGRKYRVGLIVGHQMLAQLEAVPRIEGALLSSCHTRIVFRVGEGDARKLAEGFSFFDASDLSALHRGEAIARIGGASNDFNLRTLPLSRVDEDEAEQVRSAIVERTRARFAVRREVLGAEASATDVEDAKPVAPEAMAAETELPGEAVPEAVPQTISSGGAPPRTRKTTRAVSTPGRGGEQHKYLQHLIKRLAEERGFRATIEDAAHDGRADVVLRRDEVVVGCEISITTDAAHEIENLKKCLAAGFTHVFFVAAEKKQRTKVASLVRKQCANAPVVVIGPEDIVAALDALGPMPQTKETVVRGYKVKVTRQQVSPEDELARRKAVAGVIARAMKK